MEDMATAPFALMPDPPIWRMSVERYHALVRAGAFTSEDRVELLEGVIVERMPQNSPHACLSEVLGLKLNRVLPAGWCLRSQRPITLTDSEPEPDLAVARGELWDYGAGHPGPKELGVVIEVSDSTLQRDRGQKKRVYARACIPVYALFDISGRTLEIYTHPQGDDYQVVTILNERESVAFELDGVKLPPIALAEIFPPR
jgi:Uma2 family endonuclease